MSKKKTNDEPELPETPQPETSSDTESVAAATGPEQQNVYEYQMSSTETSQLNPDDFWKLKLTA